MTAMAVEKSPPDPPPPDDPPSSLTDHETPPSEDDSNDVRNTQDSENLEEFYEFSITIQKPNNDIRDFYSMPSPHTQVNDVLNVIRRHYPDAVLYSHITRCEVPVDSKGNSKLSKSQLSEQADAVEHPSARGKTAYKFLLQSQHGNVESLKQKNARFRRDLPEMVSVENCLDGYPLRGRVGFMLNIAPTVAFREVAKLMKSLLATMELDEDRKAKRELNRRGGK